MAADVNGHHLARVTWRPADPPAHGLDSWPAGKRHWLVGTGGLGAGRKPCMGRLQDSGLLHTERWEPERQDPTASFLSDCLERSPVLWKCSLSSKYFWRDQTQETPPPPEVSLRGQRRVCWVLLLHASWHSLLLKMLLRTRFAKKVL